MIMEPFRKKRVLFITTKNLDYIRNTQELRLLKEAGATVSVIGSRRRSYPVRLAAVYFHLLFCRASRYDCVFFGFSPQLTLPVFHWKFRRLHCAIDFFISLYDTCVCDRNYFRPGSLPARFLHWLDTVTLRHADVVFCDTRAHAHFFAEEFDADPDREKVLYLEADPEYYNPSDVPVPARRGEEFHVLYFGSILPLQGVEVILDAVRLLAGNSRIRFTLIGPLKESEVREFESQPNVILHRHLSQRALASEIAGADLCLAGHFHPTIGKAGRTIPGKAFIYRKMGKPMILGDSPANRELFSESDSGIDFVPRGDAAELARKIVEISERKSSSL